MGVEIEKLGIVYGANSSALLTGIIFDKWLHQLNLRMHGRKILLLLDKTSSHKVRRELNSVMVVFYPPYMIFAIQPLDAGTH